MNQSPLLLSIMFLLFATLAAAQQIGPPMHSATREEIVTAIFPGVDVPIRTYNHVVKENFQSLPAIGIPRSVVLMPLAPMFGVGVPVRGVFNRTQIQQPIVLISAQASLRIDDDPSRGEKVTDIGDVIQTEGQLTSKRRIWKWHKVAPAEERGHGFIA
jgi:hypothetical protein